MWTQIMNKAALVTMWVEPKTHQIVKYTFDNVSLDFFPAAWLVRPTSFKASMTMSQAFKGVWLPRQVEINLGALFATGPIDVLYRIEYREYQEATASARIKRVAGVFHAASRVPEPDLCERREAGPLARRNFSGDGDHAALRQAASGRAPEHATSRWKTRWRISFDALMERMIFH